MIFLLAIILLLLCNVNGLKQINRPNSNVWIAKELESLDEMSTSKIGELMTDLDNKGLFYIKKLAQTNHALRLQDRFQRFSDNNERFHCFMGGLLTVIVHRLLALQKQCFQGFYAWSGEVCTIGLAHGDPTRSTL